MIQEAYVSFETAKLLKEKGFDEYCPKSYFKIDKTLKESGFSEWEKVNEIKAPTQSLAMKWLREVHHLAINIGWTELPNDEEKWYCIVISMNNSGIYRESTYHITYEEACEVAIKYCLENLI